MSETKQPRALLLTHSDGRETLHSMSEAATAYRDTAKSQTLLYEIPHGWALVPLEPTRHMMESAPALPAIVESDLRLRRLGWSLQACQNRRRYLAMLAAAPKP
jgi:hypothetical protein